MTQTATFINHRAFKALLVLLVVFATAFYAFPQAFLHSTAKIRKLTNVSTEITEQIDLKNSSGTEIEPELRTEFWLSLFSAAETVVVRQYCAFTHSAFQALNHQHQSLYCLNCSFTFYG